ncbi:MAG: undecaprenyl-diphosphate phosphatase [Patescibacteria group bacterium]|jgi:undecaprenyl-diphosphatase
MMLNYFQAIFLGVVEGITEFLPISSTAHLILASSVLNISQSAFQKSFEIIIQLGAIFAVVALYWRTLFDLELIKRLVVSFIPTGIIGLALYSLVKRVLLGNMSVVIWSLFLGGVFLLAFERLHGEKATNGFLGDNELSRLSYKNCLLIGLAQSFAIIPGVSRSAATVVGGLLLGMKRTAIVEFSFLLAVPTMAAATSIDILKNYQSFSLHDAALLLVGFIVSFFVALASIRLLLGYVRQHDFKIFGIYRIFVAFFFFVFRI